MAKEKDPAFLFYSKDWLEGTAEMTPDEKGVFIDLLCHQHQKKDLPADTKRLARLVGLSEADFLPIWDVVRTKFVEINNRMFNPKLTKIATERFEKGHRNTIIGSFAGVLKSRKLSGTHKEIIKRVFNYEDFLLSDDHLLTEKITEWLDLRLKSIANANINGDGNGSDLGECENPLLNPKPPTAEIPRATFPGPERHDLVLPEMTSGSVIQLFRATQKKVVDERQVQDLWEVFKIQNLTGKKFYQDDSEIFSHFINWCHGKKIDDAANNNAHTGGGSKPGTSEARIGAARQFGTSTVQKLRSERSGAQGGPE